MELVSRFMTSIVLCALIVLVLLFLTPAYIVIVVACVYGYALCIEYIPLARRSFVQIPLVTVMTGTALVVTGAFHAFWLFNSATRFYVFICVGAAILSDTGGYVIGKLFGKHLLVPVISPKKTWEGLVGSIVITSIIFYFGSHGRFATSFLGALLACAALAGDLLFSYLKRVAGVKDTGTLLPGHGGILDRLDSIVGTTTIFAFIVLLFKVSNQINLFY